MTEQTSLLRSYQRHSAVASVGEQEEETSQQHISLLSPLNKPNEPCRRLLELAANIKSAFEPAIQTSIYPRSQIDIFVTILQQDGSLLQTCINATSVALVNAGIPLLDYVCAVTGGIHSTAPMLDLTALEENDLPNVTLAMMPKTSKLTMVTMETQLHIDRFEEILRLACEAGSVIQCEMKVAVREKTISLVAAMNIAPKLATMGEDEDD